MQEAFVWVLLTFAVFGLLWMGPKAIIRNILFMQFQARLHGCVKNTNECNKSFPSFLKIEFFQIASKTNLRANIHSCAKVNIHTANLYSWTTSLLRLKSCRVQLVVVQGNLLHDLQLIDVI